MLKTKYLLPLILIFILTFVLIGNCADLFGTYDQRIKLTIDNTKIDSDLTWFPVMIKLTDAQMEEVFAEFNSDDDFDRCAITLADESTQIYGDCERFDDSESVAEYHVAKTGVVTDADALGYLYFYYDKDAAHNTTYISKSGGTVAQSVWDGNFSAVYHMVGADIEEKYLTGWSKSGENPLIETVYGQGWLTAVYSNYNNEDKIYIFVESAINSIKCYSFTRANAGNTAQWTDHGTVITGSNWCAEYIEPHGIFFETQAMADAREEVGEGEGTPKWRLYVCARESEAPVKESDVGFFTAPESDLTDWTAYAGNPVYAHDASYGYGDPKMCIQDDEVWMMIGVYPEACDHSLLTKSTNGIDNWTTIQDNLSCRLLIGTLVPFSTGILLTENPSPYTTYDGEFLDYDGSLVSYSGNPIMGAGAVDSWERYLAWCSIVVDKDGDWNLKGLGTSYLYYSAWDTAEDFGFGLATTSTLTEETETAADKILDSTSNNNNGTKKGAGEPAETAGKVGQGQDFDGDNDYIDLANDLILGTNATIEVIIKPDAIESTHIISHHGVSGNRGWYFIIFDDTTDIELAFINSDNGTNLLATFSTNADLAIETYYHVAVVKVDTATTFYKAGSPLTDDGTAIYSTTYDSSSPTELGAYKSGQEGFYDGIEDEVRYSDTNRSAGWIKATYNSLWDTLLTYGSEETAPSGTNVLFMFTNF